MGSFNRFHNNCLRDSLLVPIVNCATSIFAGFVVFSVLGFLSHKLGTAVSSVTTAGPSLAFITFPEALTLMPLAPLWAVTFFLMLFFLGVDSIFVQMEAMVVSLVDEYPRLRVRKTLVAFISCLICFLGSLSCCTQGGMYMLQLLDFYAVPLTIILTTLGEIIVFAYIYGGGRVVQDLQVMTGRVVNEMWYFAWIGFTPFVLLFILVNIVLSSSTQLTYKEYVYPSWATMLGWLTAIASLIAIPIYFVYYLATAKGSFAKRLEYAFKPTPVWGPALESHRQDWTEYTLRHPLPDRFLHPNFKGAIPRLSTPRP
ncbi:sodium- and chloride-dependent glycine transporter 2-like [Homarus americanus]|uniref:sodium- and chloride-dependent glycine transporter 2-like n=1 Tax=Homarus americanus TaxID=6706 RepID=UPI001C43FDCF|nr:sodium- and chloride-dependent glycine transporter 2-like [Homarus americanus]